MSYGTSLSLSFLIRQVGIIAPPEDDNTDGTAAIIQQYLTQIRHHQRFGKWGKNAQKEKCVLFQQGSDKTIWGFLHFPSVKIDAGLLLFLIPGLDCLKIIAR